MLTWLACHLLAPSLPLLTDGEAPDLPDPSDDPDLAARAAAAGSALDRVPFQPRGETNPFKLLLGMGCRDLVAREMDQNPDTAGTAGNFEGLPFAPVEIPVEDGPTLTGHHSLGAPGAPVVIVVHGLFDSHVAAYVVEYAEALRRWGFHVFALDLRDHGRLLGRSTATLGLAEGRDLFRAAATLSRAEGVSVGMLGISYGGHCVVRAAHEATRAGEAGVLRGGVMALGAPLDIHEAVLAFDDPSRLPRGESFLDRRIFGSLFGQIRRHLKMRCPGRRLPDPGSPFESYVRHVVLPAVEGSPPLVGAYLGEVRCTRPEVMAGLEVPVAVVHSTDDFLVPVTHLHKAREAAGDNPWVYTRELSGGGHVGLGAADPEGTLGLLGAFFGTLRDG